MSAQRKNGSLTTQQRKMVQAARKQLLLSDKNYREILRVCAGVQSSTELGQEGLEAVLAFFESLGWTNTSPKHHRLGLRPGMASDAQLARLRRLAASYFTGGDAALGKWLERFGASHPRFLSAEGAQKALIALDKMTARRSPPAA